MTSAPPSEHFVLVAPLPRSLGHSKTNSTWQERERAWRYARDDWREQIRSQLPPGQCSPIFAGPVRLVIRWRYVDPLLGGDRPDYDNAVMRLAPAFDALAATGVLADDHQIIDVTFEWEPVTDEAPGLRIEIRRVK